MLVPTERAWGGGGLTGRAVESSGWAECVRKEGWNMIEGALKSAAGCNKRQVARSSFDQVPAAQVQGSCCPASSEILCLNVTQLRCYNDPNSVFPVTAGVVSHINHSLSPELAQPWRQLPRATIFKVFRRTKFQNFGRVGFGEWGEHRVLGTHSNDGWALLGEPKARRGFDLQECIQDIPLLSWCITQHFCSNSHNNRATACTVYTEH